MTVKANPEKRRKTIYLAGPLFTVAERAFNIRLRNLLKLHGFAVWLPQDNEPRELTPKNIFDKDVEGIHASDIIVAIMDGPDPDSGTSWEVGYGYALGKYIVEVRTDFRGIGELGGIPYNLMLTESANHVIKLPSINYDVESVAHAVALHLHSATLTVGRRI